MEVVKSGFQSSLLVRHPETKELYVNFDPQILTLIREAECMARLNLEVPAAAVDLRAKQNMLKQNYNAMLVGECFGILIILVTVVSVCESITTTCKCT